jgi:hypothetical protein
MGYLNNPFASNSSPHGWESIPDEDLLDMAAGSLANTGAASGSSPTYIDPAKDAAFKRDIWSNVGLGAGVGAAQMALQAIPTAFDRHNKERLDYLQQLQANGKLGLSGEERTQMERTLLTPVRALATEGRQRTEAQIAGAGDTSAAAVNDARDAAQRQAQDAAAVAAGKISQANLDMANAQLQEIESRVMHKADKQKAILSTAAKTISGVGETVATARAGRAVPTIDSRAFIEAGGTYEQLGIIMEALQGLDKGGRWDALFGVNTTPNRE